MALLQDIQGAVPGERVELFVIDLTQLNGGTILKLYLTNTVNGDSNVMFDGQEYTAVPCEMTDIKIDTSPTVIPTLRVSNIGSQYTSVVNQYNEFLGATIKRITTFKKYLDGEVSADAAQSQSEIYIFKQIKMMSSKMIEWELGSKFDVENLKLPKRQCLNHCTFTYRKWNGSSFDVGTCPYTGSGYFDRLGNITNQSGDLCGKRESDCKLRFGENAEIPFGGFASIKRG